MAFSASDFVQQVTVAVEQAGIALPPDDDPQVDSLAELSRIVTGIVAASKPSPLIDSLLTLKNYLLRTYGDDTWDEETRALFDAVQEAAGEPPIVWQIEPESA